MGQKNVIAFTELPDTEHIKPMNIYYRIYGQTYLNKPGITGKHQVIFLNEFNFFHHQGILYAFKKCLNACRC